jgi:hypothetical protein
MELRDALRNAVGSIRSVGGLGCRDAAPRFPATAPRATRHSDGVRPLQRRNARLKAFGLA